MSTVLIDIRRARPDDAGSLAEAHDEAWRNAYRGLIPGAELEKLVARRGASWWDAAIRRGSRISLLTFGDAVAGYANYGRNRAKSLPYGGEIYEIYLRPEYQGLGFGRKLFVTAKRDLVSGRPPLARGVGALRQRAGDELLSRARRPHHRPLHRALRRQGARQGRLRLDELS